MHMVRAFQLASRRAGVFVWFRVLLSGAKFSLACQEGQSHELYAPRALRSSSEFYQIKKFYKGR